MLTLLATVASPVDAQVADYYRGDVQNAGVSTPATLEFSIYHRSDSAVVGWLKIGSPLEGSGQTVVILDHPDSLYLLSMSASGDTILWGSASRAGSLGGDYWVRGGAGAGQSGTWRLTPAPRIAPTALLCFALASAGGVVLLLSLVGRAIAPRWWRWRLARAPEPTTFQETQSFAEIGGWLGLVVIGNAALALLALSAVAESRVTFGGEWMLGAAAPSLRIALFLETTTRLLQGIAGVVGIVLIVRRSTWAPAFFQLFLPLTGLLVVCDWALVDVVMRELRLALGEGALEAIQEMEQANAANGKVIVYALIWSLYWAKSRRVAFYFPPGAARTAVTAGRLDVMPGGAVMAAVAVKSEDAVLPAAATAIGVSSPSGTGPSGEASPAGAVDE